MGMVQYSSMDRRFFHKLGATLLDRTLCSSAGKFGLKATLGGSVGMDPERFDEAQAHHPLGRQPDRLQPAPVVARAGGEAARREGRGDRSLSQPVGGEVHAARRAPSRHRRRARARHDARADRRGPDRSRLHRASTRWVSSSSQNASKQYTPEWAARTCGITARGSGAARARLRHHEAGRDPPQLRHAAPRRRRHRRAHHRLPAGAHRRVARGGRRHRAHHRRTSTSSTTPRSSVPTCSPGGGRASSTTARWATRSPRRSRR